MILIGIDQKKVEDFINELKNSGKEISGGNKDKLRPSYILRDPEFYWNFGIFLVQQAQKIDKDKRLRWIIRETTDIEKSILGPTKDDWLIPKIYTWVDELQDKEHFMYVANLAGHKFGSFRIKVLEYIYDIFSKKHPSEYSDSKKKKLADILLGKKLQHLGPGGINDVLKKFRGKSPSSYRIKNEFNNLNIKVEDAVNSDNKTERELLKNEIGKNMIDKLRTYLQILPLKDSSLFEEMVSEYKNELSRKISTKNDDAKKLDEVFGKCIKDKELRNKTCESINAYDMGQTNTFLNAIESDHDYEEWKRTKENFAQMQDSR